MSTNGIDKEELRSLVKQLVQEALGDVKQRLQYTHVEAAAMLGLSEGALHSERKLGRIKGRQAMRRRFFYRPRDLADYVRRDYRK